ncbi:TrmB family transcriptional regulator [Nanoarchaeota archaeon]
MELKRLKNIGLTEGEIKVYEALLVLGESTKTKLVKEAGIAPSNLYDIANRLIEKGIISKVVKNGVAHFSPVNPKHILDFLDEKEKEIEDERNIVNSILPTLLARFQESKEKVNVEVFQGWNGMKTVFDDLIEQCKKGDKNYVFGASKGESDKKGDIFFLKYSRMREKKGIFTKIIFNHDMKERKERINFFLQSKMYDVKFLQQTTPTEIMVYKDVTAIIILTKEPLVIRITGKEASYSFKQYFNSIWDIAKS